jgi:hypothetical protein
MVEASQPPAELTYEVSFEMKKNFTPTELTGKLIMIDLIRTPTFIQAIRY